jgi:hypothetical protein
MIREMLGARAQRMKWPLLFRLTPSDPSFADRAPFVIDNQARIAAPPERVFDELVGMENGTAWVEHFLRLDWVDRGEAVDRRVYDETFSFMSLRIRNIVAERGRLWIASVDACSFPLARQMLEVATFEPDGDGTLFRWRVHYEPPAPVRPFRPVVQPFFERMFRRSTERLAEFCAKRSP